MPTARHGLAHAVPIRSHRPERFVMPIRRHVTAFVALSSAAAIATMSVPQAVAGPDDAPNGDSSGTHSPPSSDNQYVARGRGGAVASVDEDATRIGVRVLRAGGTATDAAVATAAALGVTEPYSAGIGGGGFFVHYDAKTGKVETIDGREKAPAKFPHDAFIDPETG